MIGDTVLHYKILEKLGEGGMGVVYLAEDINLERKVAIKFLPGNLSLTSEDKERFKIEAKAAAALNHPNISTIYSIEQTDKELFIAMEYVEGKELKDIVETNRDATLPIDDVINYATQIAEGLEAAHKKGIVHRDIKSQNIMIAEDQKVKIMDFGLAKINGGSQLTKLGTTVGTLAYMSPEQARGEEVDQRTDIWSFGVILYEMLTGEMPFKGEYEQAVAYSILNEEPGEIKKPDPDIPDALLQIVKNSLEKDVGNRYQSVQDILIDLKKINQGGTSETQSPVQVKSTSKAYPVKIPFFSKKIIMAAALICLVAAAISIYFLLLNKNASPPLGNQSESLAVMYFENIPDPKDEKHTGYMITNLLITALSQTKGLEVISSEQLYKILNELGQTDTKIISRKTAITVAQNAGVKTILLGSIIQKEPSLAVTTRLIDVSTGKILGSQRLIGFIGSASEQIFSFVDSLAFLVRNDLNISPTETSDTKSVSEVTTNSPEAYRAYVEGLDLYNKFYVKEAAAAFKETIELDSTFAMAFYYLSRLLRTPEERKKAFQKAVELADKTTEREKLLILAKNYVDKKEPKKAAELYEQLIKKYPRESEPYLLMSNLSSDLMKDANTKELLRHNLEILRLGIKNIPKNKLKLIWYELAYTYAALNEKKEAMYAVRQYIKLSPSEPFPYVAQGDVYAFFMKYDSSRASYEKALEFRDDIHFLQLLLGNYDVINGKYKEAQKYFETSGISPLLYPSIDIHRGKLNSDLKRLSEALNSKHTIGEKFYIWSIAQHLYYETGRFAEMLQMAKESSIEGKKLDPKNMNGRDYVAWALVKNGKSKEAENLINDIIKNSDKFYPFVKSKALLASAIISFEEGKYELTIEKFKNIFSNLRPNHEPNLFYAVSLLKTGLIPESIEELSRIKKWPLNSILYWNEWAPGGLCYGYIPNVKAHYWLGVAYEKLGEKEKAIKEYKIFLDTWKEADFDSPEIKDAKVRLEKLDT
jgi:serine/threonine protein kinase/predicted Zn-dependent protease